MPRTISEIYSEYKIMPNLQEHMFRVAAVASLICDNFTEPLDKDTLMSACLLHDMGNMVKLDLERFPEFNEPAGIEYWREVKNGYIEKYGSDDHLANIKILQEIGLSEEMIKIAGGNTPKLVCKFSKENDILLKIEFYGDARVSPHGVLSYEERQAESTKRYEKVAGGLPPDERKDMVKCGKDIEREIFAHCKIKPSDITDESIVSIMEELKNFVIK